MSFLHASSREQYVLRLAVRLGLTYYTKVPMSLQQVAKLEHISGKYLEELIVPLKRQGFVSARSGRNGGYLFIKSPRRVSVKDVLWPNALVPAVTACTTKAIHCPWEKSCGAKSVWQRVQSEVENTLSKVCLDSLLNHSY
jgi:Rrf2 family protein